MSALNKRGGQMLELARKVLVDKEEVQAFLLHAKELLVKPGIFISFLSATARSAPKQASLKRYLHRRGKEVYATKGY